MRSSMQQQKKMMAHLVPRQIAIQNARLCTAFFLYVPNGTVLPIAVTA